MAREYYSEADARWVCRPLSFRLPSLPNPASFGRHWPPGPACAPVGRAAHTAEADGLPAGGGVPAGSLEYVPGVATFVSSPRSEPAGVRECPGQLCFPGVGMAQRGAFSLGVGSGRGSHGVPHAPTLDICLWPTAGTWQGLPREDGQFPNAFLKMGQGSLSVPSFQSQRQEEQTGRESLSIVGRKPGPCVE